MKGKKFDAHEKHFKKKEIKLNQEINYLRNRLQDISEEKIELAKKNAQLDKENTEIKLMYEKIKEYSKLSDEDIKEALKRDKSASKLSDLLDIVHEIR